MNKILWSVIVFVVALSCSISLSAHYLSAQTSNSDLTGFAWGAYIDSVLGTGPSGLGWLSFNSLNHTGGNSYKVTVDPLTGALSGYAWSGGLDLDNNIAGYGWLSFDRSVTGEPPVTGTLSTDNPGAGILAKKVGSSIVGWGRFISACQGSTATWDGTKCLTSGAGMANGVLSGSSTDGQYWDGWVSLSKKSSDAAGASYGLTIDDQNHIQGYAWGSHNVGWIYFGPGAGGGITPTTPVDVIIGGDMLAGSCTATIVSAVSPYSAKFTANITGGGSPFHYKWSGEGLSTVGDTPIANVTYSDSSVTNGRLKTAILEASKSNYTGTTTKQCSVTFPGGTDTGFCSVPTNARLRTDGVNTSDTNGPASSSQLKVFGGWGSAIPFMSCQFECINSNYIIRNGQCVRKSVIIEQ